MSEVLQSQVDEVRNLMATRLHVRGKTLGQQVRKAGRLLPRVERREATYLAQVETVMTHPKLSRMVDLSKAANAHQRVVTFLKTVDPVDRRKGQVLGLLGSLAFAAIVVFIVVVFVLVQRGIV